MPEPHFRVVINHELQVSLWPVPRPVPLGWAPLDFQGTRQDCLQHIDATWIDMRPLSARIGAPSEASLVPEGPLIDGFVASDARGWCFGCSEQGRPLEPHCQVSGPLVFSRGREDALANAAAAAAADPRYHHEFLRCFLAPSLLRDGMRLFQARGRIRGQFHSQLWADGLEIGQELDLRACPLWDLWISLTQDQSPESLHPAL